MKKYTVRCIRSGAWWAISAPEINGLFSQARHLDQVEGMAREAIALMLDVDPQSFAVDVQHNPAQLSDTALPVIPSPRPSWHDNGPG